MSIRLRPRILVFVDYYLPGYKSGGPLRTVSHMVEQMGEVFDFMIITRDRDATDTRSYPSIEINQWNQVGRAKVYYASPSHLSLRTLHSLIQSAKPDILYCNSFFSSLTIRCLLLRRLQSIPATPVVLAPRGEFSPGALDLKYWKKILYIKLSQILGLYRNIVWQASSTIEEAEICTIFSEPCVHVAPDIPAAVKPKNSTPPVKKPGQARFIFLSRISPKKNLHYALELMSKLSGSIDFSIVGPVRDKNYWDTCQQAISQLPNNIKVDVVGAVPHNKVQTLLMQHHFFILPTLGENFGHAILEAMGASLPVVISDQTPWQELSKRGAGWEIALDDDEKWQSILQQCVQMTQSEYSQLSDLAEAFAIEWSSNNSILKTNQALFRKATSR